MKPALDAISGLSLMASNYEEAIAILKKRFGNKQQIINRHMDILVNVSPGINEDTRKLRKLLLQGPDAMNQFMGVLTRFVQGPVTFMGDTNAMLVQVRVPEGQRDLLRFLWWPDRDLMQNLEEYQMNVHLFGAVSSLSG